MAAGILTQRPLGSEPVAGGLLTWWEHATITGPALPAAAARWLRELHDRADATDLTPAVPRLPVRPPLPEARDLASRLVPWLERAQHLATKLHAVPHQVLVHGDANPTNLVATPAGVTGLDFGAAGRGPRVVDVAAVAVLALETGAGTVESVLAAYGPHDDVDAGRLADAAQLVAIARAATCVRVPGWLAEGYDRLAALTDHRPYLFPVGTGPK